MRKSSVVRDQSDREIAYPPMATERRKNRAKSKECGAEDMLTTRSRPRLSMGGWIDDGAPLARMSRTRQKHSHSLSKRMPSAETMDCRHDRIEANGANDVDQSAFV